MPYTCNLEGRLVHVCWSGVISAADLEEFGRQMPQIGRQLGAAPDVLHTFEGAEDFSFEPIAAYHHSLAQRKVAIPNPIRAAVVATTQECEALATAFKTLNRTPNLEMKVFSNEAAARLWLSRT